MSQSKEVMIKIMPMISFNIGITGFVSASLSSRLNKLNCSLMRWYLTLNLVNLVFIFLLPRNFCQHPYSSSFLSFRIPVYFIYSPVLMRSRIALTNFLLTYFISYDFLTFGRNLNSLIRSMGNANNPTPPKKTTKNQPNQDKMAIV